MSSPPVELFSTIYNDIYDVAQFPQFSGISVLYSSKFSPKFAFSHQFSMNPRIYPAKDSQQSGEPKQPGSYAFNIVGEYKEKPIMLLSNDLWFPKVGLTIPFPNSSLSFNYNFGVDLKSYLDLEAVIQNQFFSYEGTLSTKNLSPGSFTSSIASKFKKLRFGITISKMIGQEDISSKFVFDFPIKKTNFGTIISKPGRSELYIVASSRTTFKNTTVGVELQAFPTLFKSELIFGYERAFTMSRIYTNATMSGTVSTLYARQLNQNDSLNISITADMPARKYELGLRLNLYR